MKSYYFCVCGIMIHVEAEMELHRDAVMEQYETQERDCGIHITLCATDKVQIPQDKCPALDTEYPVWQQEDRINHYAWDFFRREPHFFTEYSLEKPGEVTCRVARDTWPWATSSKYFWTGIMLNYLLLPYRGMILHASYVDYKGSGIVFVAPSGTGKSTQAALWETYRGARICNGDKAGIRLGEIPMVHGVPFSGSSNIGENISLPLKAVVVLAQAPENTIERMAPTAALKAILPNVFVKQKVPQQYYRAVQLLLDMVQAVPVYLLACTPDERAVVLLEKTLFQASEERGCSYGAV